VPDGGECVVCFIERMVTTYGCSNQLTFARLWRSRAAPRATALERRLGAKGGYCDCEVLMNAYVRRDDFARELARQEPSGREPPPCRGVGRGSAQPCSLWIARPRGPRGWW
jgi:hypothetical protein